MAAVFEVEDPESGERLAVKLLTHRGLAAPRFRREYEALTRLDHPNIVRVYRFGFHEGCPYLTMELLDGVPVQVHAKSQGRPGTAARTDEVLRVAGEVVKALAYLHARNIVHRDLKSANVLVLSDGRVKLLDFGTARFLGATRGITRQGEFVGTFAYASPEQIKGEELDPRSDLYSLGALLYRLFTGKRVFEADSPHKVARMHVRKSPVPPAKRVPALPGWLNDVILHLLAKAPDQRPSSARELWGLLHPGEDSDEGISTPPSRTAAPGAPLRSPRLVGRNKELAALRATLDKARSARMMMVIGQPGSGRARFLRKAVAEARQRGWRVFGGRFSGGQGLDVLAEVAEAAWSSFPQSGIVADLDEAMAEFRRLGWEDGREEPTPARRNRLSDVLATVLIRRSEIDNGPLVVSLGELHRASPAALDAITHLRQRVRLAEVPVIFLCGCTEDADAPRARIRQRFPDAWRQHLRPLTPQEVGELVGVLLGSRPVGPELGARIHEATGGMPGFVEEVVRAMVHDRQVVARTVGEHVAWVDRSEGRIAIPGSVREALTLRLSNLSREQVRALEAVAVVGEAAGVAPLAFGLEWTHAQTQERLDGLVTARYLERREGSSGEVWDFRLGLARELVLERIRLSRRYVFRIRLAEALRDRPPGAAKIQLLASAGQIGEAVQDALLWAEPLLDDDRAVQVLPVLEAVHQVLRGANIAPTSRARFQLLRARALGALQPGSAEVTSAFRQAVALAVTPTLKGEVDLYESRVRLDRGELDEARNLLDRARQRLGREGSPRLKAKVELDLGAMHWYQGAFEAAARCYERALGSARHARRDKEIAAALVGRAVVRISTGGLQVAENELREAIRLFEAIGDRDGQWHAQINLADILRHRAAYSEALSFLQPEMTAARAIGSRLRYAYLALNVAEVETELFRLGRARERLDALETELEGLDQMHFRGSLELARARIAIASRDYASVRDSLEEQVRITDEADLLMSSHLRAILGEALVGMGEVKAGAAMLKEAIDRLDRAVHLPQLAEACAARARALGDREDPELIFAPVWTWLHREPARAIRMELFLASARYAHTVGARSRARSWYLQAEALLREIQGDLAEPEQAAIAVHPWRRAVQKGLEG